MLHIQKSDNLTAHPAKKMQSIQREEQNMEELEINGKRKQKKKRFEILLPQSDLVKLIGKVSNPSLTPILMKLIFPLVCLDFPNS